MKTKNIFTVIILTLITAFIVNLAWELLHSPLYDWTRPPLENSLNFYLGRILQSAFFDAVWIAVITALSGLITGFKYNRIFYGLLFVLLLFFSFGLEWHRISEGAWHYKDLMPTLQDLGLVFPVGLSPLVQLALTGLISARIAIRLSAKTGSK